MFVGNDTGRVKPHGFYQACRVTGRNTTACKEVDIDGTTVIEVSLDPSTNMTLAYVLSLTFKQSPFSSPVFYFNTLNNIKQSFLCPVVLHTELKTTFKAFTAVKRRQFSKQRSVCCLNCTFFQGAIDSPCRVDCVGILKLRNADVEARIGVAGSKKKSTRARLVFRVNIPRPDGSVLTLQTPSSPILCSKSVSMHLCANGIM